MSDRSNLGKEKARQYVQGGASSQRDWTFLWTPPQKIIGCPVKSVHGFKMEILHK